MADVKTSYTMKPGIIAIEVDDPETVVVNVRNSEGRVVEAHNVGKRFKEIEKFRAERDTDVQINERLRNENTRLRDEIESLKAESKEWRDRAYQRGEEAREIGKKYNEAKQNRIENGTPLYLIDQKLVDGLKLLVGMKPGPIEFVPEEPKWRQMETAPTDGTRILIFGTGFCQDIDRGVSLDYRVVGKWQHDIARWVTAHGNWDITTATHWMPLPEPPR